MMTVQPYITLPEIVPQQDILAWKQKIRAKQPAFNCPVEVRQFIDAIANKLGDFGRIRNYTVMMKGKDLLLTGIKEVRGEQVFSFASYPIEVPLLMAVDHETSLLRLFRLRGKQGLIDFCRAKVKGTELERVLEILNVHVFHQERPEFLKVLHGINQSKKLEVV